MFYKTPQNIRYFILVSLLFFFGNFAQANPFPITAYHATFIPGYDTEGELQVATRMYYLGDTAYFLLVNPMTLITKVLPVTDFKTRNPNTQAKTAYYTMAELRDTPYLKALSQYSAPPYLLQNYGLTHSKHSVAGVFLTVDMCPASKPFEEGFFKTLALLAEKTQQPVPVALSMSGLWMLTHPQEFDWLIAQTKTNKLAVTWVNHSFSHIYYRDLPLEKNFMLDRPTDFDNEIFETEKILLQKQQLPSVFFRYPGLVANKPLILKLRELGLIPLGSDAWLAKGEIVKKGSIILIHGNSNEHAGIEKVLPLLQQPDLNLLPLNQAIL